MLARIVAAAALGLIAQPTFGQTPASPTPANQDPAGHAQSPAARATFKNFNRTFQIEVPTGWRQIAPNEAVQLSENPAAPRDVHPASPTHAYSVGPIDAWLQGDFSGAWIYVIERRDQWYISDDFEEFIRQHWRTQSQDSTVTHVVHDVGREKVGTQGVECIVATRTSTAAGSSQPIRSLDVHAPTAKQQIVLSFSCPEEQFARWQPEFRSWIASLTFARPAQDPATLADRLWTPMLVGGGVGLVLLLLYKHTRAKR